MAARCHYRLEDLAADVASLCDSVFGGEPAIICGHSLGGQVALVLAAERPDLPRAVIIGDTPLSLGTLQQATDASRQVATTWRALAASRKSTEDIAAELEEMSVPAMDGSGHMRPAREVFGAGHPYLIELSACLAAHDPALLDEVVLARFASTRRSLDASLLCGFEAPVLLVRADPLPAACCRPMRRIRHENYGRTWRQSSFPACPTGCTCKTRSPGGSHQPVHPASDRRAMTTDPGELNRQQTCFCRFGVAGWSCDDAGAARF
jgi:pimeloyl-ACP methyl ester carboxylesterase